MSEETTNPENTEESGAPEPAATPEAAAPAPEPAPAPAPAPTPEPAADAGGGEKKRPAFLTVLCILSFVFSGIAIILYILAIVGMGAGEAFMSAAENMAEGMGAEAVETASTGMAWAYILIGLVMVILGLIGVIRMWKLKKSGFMLYVISSIVPIIMGYVAGGQYAPSMVMGIILPVAFIVMYGLNLKHME